MKALLPFLLAACSASAPGLEPPDASAEDLAVEAALDVMHVRYGLPADSPCYELSADFVELRRDMAGLTQRQYCSEFVHGAVHLVADCYEAEEGRKWPEGEHPVELFDAGGGSGGRYPVEFEVRSATYVDCLRGD